MISNKKFAATDEVFKVACSLARIEPTARQASKYRRKRGEAYDRRSAAKQTIKEREYRTSTTIYIRDEQKSTSKIISKRNWDKYKNK